MRLLEAWDKAELGDKIIYKGCFFITKVKNIWDIKWEYLDDSNSKDQNQFALSFDYYFNDKWEIESKPKPVKKYYKYMWIENINGKDFYCGSLEDSYKDAEEDAKNDGCNMKNTIIQPVEFLI